MHRYAENKVGYWQGFKGLYNLFDESPAKREDYRNIMKSDVFPQPLCGCIGVEDKKVAESALKILPNITSFVS